MIFFKKPVLQDAIIILIILVFLNFFSFIGIVDNTTISITAVYIIGLGMMAFSIIKSLSTNRIKKHPLDKLVFFFILSLLISILISYVYWDQTLLSSIKSYYFFYIYFLYFILVYLDIPPERVEGIFKLFFFASLGIFIIDFMTFPNPLFSYRSEERRDGITIFFYGQGFTFLGAYYYLNNFFKSKRIINLLLFIASFACLFFLTQSRMNLLALVLVFFFVLISNDYKKKYLIAVLLLIGAVSFYLNSNVFKGLKQDSADQAQNINEDVRILAHTYFLTELQVGIPTILFGNGVPSSDSNLGIAYIKAKENGYWTADLGLTGIFSYFGLLGTIIWLLFFYTVFKIDKSERSTYLKGYFLTLLTTAFVAYSIFEPGYMPATILVLYLTRCDTLESLEK